MPATDAPRYDITISIINYRTADLTLECLRSVLADLGDINGQIVIVDNASGDGSDDTIEAWVKAQPSTMPVRLVRSPVNTGFSGGHNLGIAAAPAEAYLVLNSDAVLKPGFLSAILKAAAETPKAGLIVPVIENAEGLPETSCFRFASPASEFMRAACTGFVTRIFKHREVSLGPTPDPEQIEWASFACILLRDDMLRDLGPMDEGYFLYFEDSEYCLRARRAGWSLAYAPKARAVHFRGGSGPVKEMTRLNKRRPSYYYASRTRFLYQAHGRAGLLAANLCWHAGRVLAHLRLFAGRAPYKLNEGEWRDIWTNFTQPLGPRLAPWELEQDASC